MSDRPPRRPRLLTAAISAADSGWPVFPVQPYGKRPAVYDWPHEATTDTRRLEAWWAQAPYNVGIACGPAGLLVIDLDHRDSSDVLARRAGGARPETYRVMTPRGEHHYFAVPPVPAGVAVAGEDYRDRVRVCGRCTAGTLEPGVDTRAAGGYVVAAGSVRWHDGQRRYYRLAGTSLVAAAPRWLLDALVPPKPELHLESEHLAVVRRPVAYVQAALDREAADVARAAAGTRNTRLFGAAVRLGQLVGGGLLTEQDVTAALGQASARHIGIDGFTDTEATRAIGNGLAYGRQRPRGLPARRAG